MLFSIGKSHIKLLGKKFSLKLLKNNPELAIAHIESLRKKSTRELAALIVDNQHLENSIVDMLRQLHVEQNNYVRMVKEYTQSTRTMDKDIIFAKKIEYINELDSKVIKYTEQLEQIQSAGEKLKDKAKLIDMEMTQLQSNLTMKIQELKINELNLDGDVSSNKEIDELNELITMANREIDITNITNEISKSNTSNVDTTYASTLIDEFFNKNN